VVWEDDRAGRFNVVYAGSADGGSTWTDDVQLNETSYGARPRLLADGAGLHLLWCLRRPGRGRPTESLRAQPVR